MFLFKKEIWKWDAFFYDNNRYEIIASTKVKKTFFVKMFDFMLDKTKKKLNIKNENIGFSEFLSLTNEFKTEFIQKLEMVNIQHQIINSVAKTVEKKYFLITNHLEDIKIKEDKDDVLIELKISGQYEKR